MASGGRPWWQAAVLYQIYVRSFADSDGDGVGDLPGIRAHLDHLADLGVDAVWLSPFYPSPMADFGYDVGDYTGVDPLFGTMEDFDRLVADAHARGIRVIIDLVPNHTSDRHPWFLESRSSRDNPKRDWYVWADSRPDGSPPNNWMSSFPRAGRAWTFDQRTGQWYLHSFTPRQPDLNWWNPEVRQAMDEVMRFWLDRGVDGFRVDVAHKMARDPERTPMQWDGSPGAGFTRPGVEPWLPVGRDAATVNVAAQRDDPASMLGLYRRLIRYRKGSAALRGGAYRSLPDAPDGCYAYLRSAGDERLLVALNFTGQPLAYEPQLGADRGRLELATDPDRAAGEEVGLRPLRLGPDEGVVVRLP